MKSWALGWTGVIQYFWGFSKTGIMLPMSYIFMSPILKIGKFGRRRGACAMCSKVFTFKNHRDLTKEYIFCRNHSTLLGMMQLISIATMTTRQLVQGFCVYTIQYIYIIQQPATCFWPLHIVTLQRASYAGSFGYLENILLELH